jgi:hypothetical protein
VGGSLTEILLDLSKDCAGRRDHFDVAMPGILGEDDWIDFQVSNMSRSAAGTVVSKKPGKTVMQKSGLNRSILDQRWAEFSRQLGYKMLWFGGLFFCRTASEYFSNLPALRAYFWR